MISFIDWFDLENENHVKAFDTCRKTGSWPVGFIPDNVIMGINWQIEIIAKIANVWMQERINK